MDHATIVSTYPPRACGIATFTSHLRGALLAHGAQQIDVAALTSSTSVDTYPDEVVLEIRQEAVQDYVKAAAQINESDTRLVSVQHEFGIFGGPEGLYLTELLTRLDKPVVTTLHTVLPEPSLPYQRALVAVARLSDRLVVMTEKARALLGKVYGVDPEKVSVIPHGVPDVPFEDPASHKAELGFEGRTVLLTFGLLGPGKGIEFVLNTLPDVAEAHPDVLYVVLGATHPEVRRRSGEEYRQHLMERVRALGLERHVRFVNRYVSQEELIEYLQACDVYITPYPGRDQVVSGTLAYAVGAGKAVVSTPYLHAEELLADGHGELVEYGDTEALARILRRLATDEAARNRLRERAYALGRTMTWDRVGRRYAEVFDAAVEAGRSVPVPVRAPDLASASIAYLAALTDDTGIFQHAPYGVPDRRHGYCTDDAGRALVVALRYYHQTGDEAALPLVRTYLSFLHHAQQADGAFRNFMSYARRFVDEQPSEDTTGRALWGLGAAAATAPDPALRQLAREMLEKAREVPLRHPRAVAYALCGLALFLRRHSGASRTRHRLVELAEQLVERYERARRPGWRWFHDEVTYGNAILPLALLHAFRVTGRPEFRTVGLETLDFLLEVTYRDDRFDFVGNQGWYRRDGERTAFAQQSIEAGYTAEACVVAYEVTGEARYLDLARAAVDWFGGRNRLGVALYDPETGACADGLEPYGASFNQGAESVIACLLGLLAVHAHAEAVDTYA